MQRYAVLSLVVIVVPFILMACGDAAPPKERTITISPVEGGPGTELTVEGRGYPPAEANGERKINPDAIVIDRAGNSGEEITAKGTESELAKSYVDCGIGFTATIDKTGKIISCEDTVVPDDHANSAEKATEITVDSAQPGDIQYLSDEDWFSFEAEEGLSYSIFADLISLVRAGLELIDTDGETRLETVFKLTEIDGEPRILDWVAPSSGTYYLSVWNIADASPDLHFTGTYDIEITAEALVCSSLDDFQVSLIPTFEQPMLEPVLIQFGRTVTSRDKGPEPPPGTPVEGIQNIDSWVFSAQAGLWYDIDINPDQPLSQAGFWVLDPCGVTLFSVEPYSLDQEPNPGVGFGAMYTGLHAVRVKSSYGSIVLTVTEHDTPP